MKINYGLWWNEGKKRLSKNFSVDFEMDWDRKEDHDKLREHILNNHHGCHIIGYAIEKNEE